MFFYLVYDFYLLFVLFSSIQNSSEHHFLGQHAIFRGVGSRLPRNTQFRNLSTRHPLRYLRNFAAQCTVVKLKKQKINIRDI